MKRPVLIANDRKEITTVIKSHSVTKTSDKRNSEVAKVFDRQAAFDPTCSSQLQLG